MGAGVLMTLVEVMMDEALERRAVLVGVVVLATCGWGSIRPPSSAPKRFEASRSLSGSDDAGLLMRLGETGFFMPFSPARNEAGGGLDAAHKTTAPLFLPPCLSVLPPLFLLVTSPGDAMS